MDSEFRRNFLALLSGSTIAQIIPLLFEPVLSRLFVPSEYGLFDLYVAFVSIIGSFVTLRYEMAIVLPKSSRQAVNIFGLSIMFTIIFSVLTSIVLLFFGEVIAIGVNNILIQKYYWLMPFGILVFGIYRSLNYWFIRKNNFVLIGSTRIVESGVKAGVTSIGGFLKMSSFGLIIGQFLGQLLSAFPMLYKFIKTDKSLLRKISVQDMKGEARKYKEFPILNLPQTIVDMINVSGVVILISIFFSPEILGQYSKTMRILLIPLALIGTSINQVFYKNAVTIYQQGKSLRPIINKITIQLIIVSLPFIIIGWFFSPEIFAFVLGDIWYVSGQFAVILIPMFFMRFILSASISIPLIVNKQSSYLKISILGTTLIVLSILIGGCFFKDIVITLKIMSWSQVLYYIVLALWLYRISK